MCDFSFLKFSLKKRKERNPFSGEWWLLHRRRRRPLLLLSCFSFALLSILWSIADMSISKSSHRILASMVWECVSLVVRRGYNEKGRGWVGFLSSGTWWAIFRSVLLHPIFAQAWWCVWVGVNSSDLDLVSLGLCWRGEVVVFVSYVALVSWLWRCFNLFSRWVCRYQPSRRDMVVTSLAVSVPMMLRWLGKISGFFVDKWVCLCLQLDIQLSSLVFVFCSWSTHFGFAHIRLGSSGLVSIVSIVCLWLLLLLYQWFTL